VTKTDAAPTRRPYDSTLRRERAAQTRERIVVAGAELIRGASIRDWRDLTIRAVAERAGVNERTVYRHFANERVLRDEVMHHLEQKVGVDLAHMRLEDVAGAAARIFEHLSAYPLDRRRPIDPTLIEANRRRHDALLAAVEKEAERWPPPSAGLSAAVEYVHRKDSVLLRGRNMTYVVAGERGSTLESEKRRELVGHIDASFGCSGLDTRGAGDVRTEERCFAEHRVVD
jgi:AcrR family transcriptional regulator